MTIEPPAPGSPRRPQGPRDPGDAWVVAESGERYWGRFGAAGLLAHDPRRGVLLQHRVGWSHHGGTWALPGGALHAGEDALTGARREAAEEAGVPSGAVSARLTSVLDLDVWSYTTLVADVIDPFEPRISDPESLELAWVPVAEVDEMPLHPGFAASWTMLRELLDVRPVIVVDAANVVGSVPDGWWRDRVGAAQRLLARLEELAASGIAASELRLPATRWFPRIVLVVEGKARGVVDTARGGPRDVIGAPLPLTTVRAAGEGDDTIVAEARSAVERGETVTVVTSDRGLRDRVAGAGAAVHGTSWLLELLREYR